MNNYTIENLQEIGKVVDAACNAFAKELQNGNNMQKHSLITYSNELEKFLHKTISKNFDELRKAIFLKKLN